MILSILLMMLIAYTMSLAFYYDHKKEDEFARERNEWHLERKELIDRIQANSYQEYKTGEIRMEKVKKKEPDKREDVVELL